MKRVDSLIDSTAMIDPTAVIAEGVEIGAMAYVGANCVLHTGVKVGHRATIEIDTEIGENTILHPNAHVGGDPQDISYKGDQTKLIIGKNTTIREFATIHRGSSKEAGVTIVGDNCYFMAYSHIAHDCKIGNNVIFANGVMLSGHIEVHDGAFLSGLVGCHQFIRVGTLSMISAVARVSKDVPPYCTVLHDEIVSLNIVGMRRKGIEANVRKEIKEAVNIFTNRSLSLEEAKVRIKDLEQYKEIIIFREFIESSKRGIIRNMAGK